MGNFPVGRDPVSSHCSLVIKGSFMLGPFIYHIYSPSYSASVKKERTQEIRVDGDRKAMSIDEAIDTIDT